MVLLSGIREVVLEQNRKGHYVAGGKVNGVPVTFLLDTGATDVAVPESIALQAGLERGNASFAATANGIVTVYSTRINELVLGNIVLKDINASITTSMVGNTILLGMSALKQIEFTQRGTTLTLHHIPET
jgi:aspartyl protease family protein